MSCHSFSSLFSGAARLSGVTRLANRRAFTTGVILGSAGLVGAGLLALARRLTRQSQPDPARVTTRPSLPNLPTRSQVTPHKQQSLAGLERCARCNASSKEKPGSWYLINGRRYCQDCAPQAARQANVDLTGPPPAAAINDSDPATVGPARLITGRSPGYLSPEKRVPTRLAESRIRLNVGQRPNGGPAWFVVNQGQVVLRLDGRDTGLAITPAVRIGALHNGVRKVEEVQDQWMITHIPSGRSLGQRAFDRIEVAHQLAGILAQVDWTRPADEISDQEIQQVNQTFHYYNQALQAEQTQRAAAPTDQSPVPAARQFQPGDPTATDPAGLTGQLIADPYGGVARVLESNSKTGTLFVVDSLGHRYEINLSEARKPHENDFRLGRIAMPVDPAHAENGSCSRCGQSTAADMPGKTWYRMDFKAFCPGCAANYAEQEAYLMPDEINSELEAQ